ncbi:MAG: aminoacyl-histidine dipeptidase [Maribacter sp.]|nr:aminoacyl-histidine dipeptidase [Maribacter sp.]
MSEEVRRLNPSSIWKHFANLNRVPRASKKEAQVIKFILAFGNHLGLETFEDKVGNVLIRKPATSGMENRKMVTLQSHLDMVHQKNADTPFDFNTQGIQMYIDNDWVKAKGTTLGADNGIGVATIMGLLESTDIPHPALEALFTVDEETGMTGALGLEGGLLKGQILLNLDTEEDDEIDIGCAGGIDVTAKGDYVKEDLSKAVDSYTIAVSKLQGGHSGIEIHKGLGNANKIMNRVLYHLQASFDLRISEIDGGGLRNAIPRESNAIIVVDQNQSEAFKKDFEKWARTIQNELLFIEPKLSIQLGTAPRPDLVMSKESQEKLIKAIYAAHNGVYAMSAAIPDLVETSNNIARVLVKNGHIKIGCLTRSSVDSSKWDMANALRSVFELAGFQVSFSGDYPGWSPNPNSAILKILQKKYEAIFGDEPKVVACHAGLECGIIGRNYPGLDMVSFGPTIKGAHSPDERVSIPSVRKFWKFLLEILKDIPAKE